MNLWTMIFGIVLVGVISEMYRARLKTQEKIGKSREREDALSDDIAALEDRIKNLETIVLEHEKLRDFDQSLP
jgi:Tfp pilus assembly protein PilN